jgi:hypothetical protein
LDVKTADSSLRSDNSLASGVAYFGKINRLVLMQKRDTATPEGAIQITTYNARDFMHFAGRPRDSNNASIVGGNLGKR